jgi:hypothetical protein
MYDANDNFNQSHFISTKWSHSHLYEILPKYRYLRWQSLYVVRKNTWTHGYTEERMDPRIHRRMHGTTDTQKNAWTHGYTEVFCTCFGKVFKMCGFILPLHKHLRGMMLNQVER